MIFIFDIFIVLKMSYGFTIFTDIFRVSQKGTEFQIEITLGGGHSHFGSYYSLIFLGVSQKVTQFQLEITPEGGGTPILSHTRPE